MPSYCADCKFVFMLKSSPVVEANPMAGNVEWLCRPCAGELGMVIGHPCSACGAPWQERSSFLGQGSAHSRSCVTCGKAYCHACKRKYMVKLLASSRHSLSLAAAHASLSSGNLAGMACSMAEEPEADAPPPAISPAPTPRGRMRKLWVYECGGCRAAAAEEAGRLREAQRPRPVLGPRDRSPEPYKRSKEDDPPDFSPRITSRGSMLGVSPLGETNGSLAGSVAVSVAASGGGFEASSGRPEGEPARRRTIEVVIQPAARELVSTSCRCVYVSACHSDAVACAARV